MHCIMLLTVPDLGRRPFPPGLHVVKIGPPECPDVRYSPQIYEGTIRLAIFENQLGAEFLAAPDADKKPN